VLTSTSCVADEATAASADVDDWSGILVLLLVVVMVQGTVVHLLLRILADDAHIRRRSPVVGAVLFVLGIMLQLIATF